MGARHMFPSASIYAMLLQLILIILFALYTRYDSSATSPPGEDKDGVSDQDPEVTTVHPMFMDVHVMIFIGFGFLMTFLRRYGYSSVGLNMLVSALSIQWAALATGFFHMENGKIPIAIDSILSADLATAAVLISLGAVLGKTSPLQLLVMAVGEIAVFATNEWLGLHIFKAVDAGGSIFVHVFGAYFGLAVSFVLCRGGTEKHHSSNEGASYRSDLFAMIGTIFLWIFWPSFNAALVTGDQQHRAIINTYFSLAACCVTAFAVSAAVTKGFKFDMVHIQNATLAGGVAVGTAADMMVQPYGALLIGMAAGTLSVFGYHFLQPFLLSKINLHDTCGVHNLHGMPGVMAGLVGAIMAGIASETDYSYSLYLQFPARAPPANSSEYTEIFQALNSVQPGDNRSAQAQAGYQLLALGCTMVIAIVAGLVMGFILRLPALSQVPPELLYDDKFTWEVPEVGDEEGCSASTGERPAASIYRPDGKRADQVLEIDS
ncbi:ammonium transporter Rh type A isoform X4 [Ischnura elegans]|uniref:ammonium transporter Rh type A isoform X4 n=1 Tax=Ischnura elegans TaxID=197161 RepID=UPI001ED89857|nr:ammonium transporter Rh type A isoform X4 [Ischnura elegans]XP_046383542.1 ammonium transporter Rh type A isoform X4 [Ischnura elegans]